MRGMIALAAALMMGSQALALPIPSTGPMQDGLIVQVQQRDQKVNGGTTQDNVKLSKDHNWRPVDSITGGFSPNTLSPQGAGLTAAACMPNWTVASLGECSAQGSQVRNLVDGCNNTSTDTQSCTPPVQYQWTYYPISVQYRGTRGAILTYMRQMCMRKDFQGFAPDSSSCGAMRGYEGCGLFGLGGSTCTSGVTWYPGYGPQYAESADYAMNVGGVNFALHGYWFD